MVIADINQFRLLRGAFLAAAVAPRVEAAALRRVDGARHITFQHVLHRGDVRIGNRNRPQQRLRVRMQRVVEQFLLRRNFDDVAQIHHSNAVADVFNDAQVVRNEDVRQLIFPL